MIHLIYYLAVSAFAASENMKTMPLAKTSKPVYLIDTKQDAQKLMENRGFGDQEPAVRMMNLMMVEGSGYEGMMMEANHSTATKTVSPETHTQFLYEVSGPTKLGSNKIIIVIKDSKTKKTIPNLQLSAELSMANMNMGADKPKINEISPGIYQLSLAFTMRGSWELKLHSNLEEKFFTFQVGDSKLSIPGEAP